MPKITYDDALRGAKAALAKAINTAEEARKAKDAVDVYRRHGEIQKSEAAAREAVALNNAIRETDGGLMVLRREAIEAAETEMARLVAKVEAERDPSVRMADELERQRLASGPISGEVLAAQAEQMLRAGQPHRAAMLIAVAEDKGAPMIGQLKVAITEALTEAESDLKKARDIGNEIDSELETIDALRYRFLAAIGLGVDEVGAAGNGSQMQITSAKSTAKMLEWRAAQREGNEYHPAKEDIAHGEVQPVGWLAGLDAARAKPRNPDGTLAS